METLLGKLSSYNIFNYLFPGIIFVIIAENLTRFTFIQKDVFLGLFLYYFIGLVISRIGSLVIEPILRRLVKFANYGDFIAASKIDNKIELLSENNNMYRTLCSLFLLLIGIRIYEGFVIIMPILDNWNTEIIVFGLFVLFMLSYKKQTLYIKKRIEINLKQE